MNALRLYAFRPTVEPILLLYMTASFLSYPVLQQLFYHVICQTTPGCEQERRVRNNSACNSEFSTVEEHVQTVTSHWILYVNIALGVPSIVTATIVGGLSDKIGRKPIMAVATAGGIINAILIWSIYTASLDIVFYLIGAALAGLFGSFTVFSLTVYSYLADITNEKERTQRFAILESMTYIGGTIGSVVGGQWIKGGNFIQPYYCIAGLYVIVWVTIMLPKLIPESLKFNSKSLPKYSAYTIACHNLKAFYDIFICSRHWNILLSLLLIFLCVELNFSGISDVIVLYSLGKPLCWSSNLIGYFLALKVLLNGIAALVVLPVLLVWLRDSWVILIGLGSGAVGLVILGIATRTWIMFLVPLVGALRGCVVPVLRAMMSKYCPPESKGVVFSSLASIETVCVVLASVMYNALYPIMRKVYPGMCFLVMAATLSLPFTLTLYLMKATRAVQDVTNSSEMRHHSNLQQNNKHSS